MKILVAGEAGQGKTTFINNMFLAYSQGKEVSVCVYVCVYVCVFLCSSMACLGQFPGIFTYTHTYVFFLGQAPRWQSYKDGGFSEGSCLSVYHVHGGE
jgi:hypothetical protein